nr:hypothetical protein Iba_chr12fCG17670 [Ipomoea batatas]GME20305.1 hypothetical protein Iba_scaffold24786CG0020 [Ipomoea batatas]
MEETREFDIPDNIFSMLTFFPLTSPSGISTEYLAKFLGRIWSSVEGWKYDGYGIAKSFLSRGLDSIVNTVMFRHSGNTISLFPQEESPSSNRRKSHVIRPATMKVCKKRFHENRRLFCRGRDSGEREPIEAVKQWVPEDEEGEKYNPKLVATPCRNGVLHIMFPPIELFPMHHLSQDVCRGT